MLAKDTDSIFQQEVTSYMDSFDDIVEEEVESINKNTSYHKYYYPEEASGICVVRHKGESVDDLIKRFRKKYTKSGLAKEVRDKMYFEKPCDRRRRKKMQSIRNIQREQVKLEEMQEQQEKFKQKKSRLAAKKKKRENEQNDQSSSRQNRRGNNDSWKDQRRAYSAE